MYAAKLLRVVLLLTISIGALKADESEQPNVLFIVADNQEHKNVVNRLSRWIPTENTADKGNGILREDRRKKSRTSIRKKEQ